MTAVEDVDPTERELAVPPPPLGTKIRIETFERTPKPSAGVYSAIARANAVGY